MINSVLQRVLVECHLHSPYIYRQVSELTQRIRSNSEIRGSSQSITSLDKGGARKPELQTAVLEDGKTGKQPQEKDKLIQAETVETGRVCYIFVFV